MIGEGEKWKSSDHLIMFPDGNSLLHKYNKLEIKRVRCIAK